MENDEVTKVLDETADMLKIAGKNFFRVRAYPDTVRAINLADPTEEEIDETPISAPHLAGEIATAIETATRHCITN